MALIMLSCTDSIIINMNMNKTLIKRRLGNLQGARNKSKNGTTRTTEKLGFEKFFSNKHQCQQEG
jgi:hypothetical protein